MGVVETAAVAGIVGSVVNAGMSMHSAAMQKKAAKSAANAAAQAASTPAAVSAANAAAATTNTQAVSERAVQTAAKRRFSVADTVNKTVGANGLRKTLG